MIATERYDMGASDSDTWFNAESMKPVHLLNEFLLTLLVAEHLRTDADDRLQLALELRETLARLNAPARQRAANHPIALVDGGFLDETRWAGAVAGTTAPSSSGPSKGNFPHLAAVRLAQMTLTLASTASQVHLERACLVFGMSPTCGRLLANLSLPMLESLAERHAEWVRPRWEHRPRVWRAMLEQAERPSPNGVRSMSLRAMQLQLGELALATPICVATRQIRR